MRRAKRAAAATAEVEPQRMSGWVTRFRFYRDPPDQQMITDWLSQFSDQHQGIASKVLDQVLVVGEPEILAGYKAALDSLPGWSRLPAEREGRWIFIGFGGAGESGPAMLRLFREANDLGNKIHHELFKSLADLPSLQLTARDHVVFIDDFSGSGQQVTRLWPTIAELIASDAICYLILTALTEHAKSEIEKLTDLRVLAKLILGSEFAVFDDDNRKFLGNEKDVIEHYCKIADSKRPRGFGNLGILFVLSHKTPNNTLPILQANHRRWRGLFPRYLRAA